MPTILCIDDDPSILELQKNLLARNGYAVLTAEDGLAGVALARNHTIDAVLLDMNMPGMNGHQVAQLLTRERSGIPIVVWSGAIDSIPEALLWFAHAVVHKGNPYQELLNALHGVLEKRRKPPASVVEQPACTGKAN
jgi:two-component system, OmpR family, response regulator